MKNQVKKAFKIILTIALTLSLSACTADVFGGGKDNGGLTYEKLAGVWVQKDREKLENGGKDAFSITFTDDGVLRFTQHYGFKTELMDSNASSYSMEGRYRIENNSLKWEYTGGHSYLNNSGNKSIQINSDYSLLTVKGVWEKTVKLIKTSDSVPYGVSQADKDEMGAAGQAMREKIIAFAAELSDQTGLPIELDDEAKGSSFLAGGVYFSSGDINLCIISVEKVEDDRGTNVIPSNPDGGAGFNVRAYVVGDYAIVFLAIFRYDDIPQEWQEALKQLNAE